MNGRPDDVDNALNILDAMVSNFSPKQFWGSKVMSPIKRYIKELEDELKKQGIQASFVLDKKIKEDGNNNEKHKDLSKDSPRLFD